MSLMVGKKIGDSFWLLGAANKKDIKLVCPVCNGTRLNKEGVYCSHCVGTGFTNAKAHQVKVLGEARIQGVDFIGGPDSKLQKIFDVVYPPPFLLPVYRGDAKRMSEEYWSDFDSDYAHASPFKTQAVEGDLTQLTYESALSAVQQLDQGCIKKVCDMMSPGLCVVGDSSVVPSVRTYAKANIEAVLF